VAIEEHAAKQHASAAAQPARTPALQSQGAAG
jgi:hypothetical protein